MKNQCTSHLTSILMWYQGGVIYSKQLILCYSHKLVGYNTLNNFYKKNINDNKYSQANIKHYVILNDNEYYQ
jgi:hypothetical protein